MPSHKGHLPVGIYKQSESVIEWSWAVMAYVEKAAPEQPMLGTRPYLLNIERNVEARSFVLWLLSYPCLSVGAGQGFSLSD